MLWTNVRKAYPDEWLIIEALEARTTHDKRRLWDKVAVIERCTDGTTAMASYRQPHRQYPDRQFYLVHTSREELGIRESKWFGHSERTCG